MTNERHRSDLFQRPAPRVEALKRNEVESRRLKRQLVSESALLKRRLVVESTRLKRRAGTFVYSFAPLDDLYSREQQPPPQPKTMKEAPPPTSEAARRHQERLFNAPPNEFLEAYKRMQKEDPVMKNEVERVGELFPRLAENYHFLQILVRLYMDYVKELEAQINDYDDLPLLPPKTNPARRLIAEFEARWGSISLGEAKTDEERS